MALENLDESVSVNRALESIRISKLKPKTVHIMSQTRIKYSLKKISPNY